MTRLGAKKKREPQTWVYLGEPDRPAPVRPPPEIWTEEQAKTACSVTLALMLLLGEGRDSDDDTSERKSWYMQCVELSCAAPMGSFRNVFWWSLRYMELNAETLEQVLDYFLWKMDQFDSGRIEREAVW